MVVLTRQYLGSRKCMLGLLTAWRLGKPIVVLREVDARYGGLSALTLTLTPSPNT